MNGKTKPGPGTTERPILFNGAMVRAILEGRKTVTRRPVKGGQIPTECHDEIDPAFRWSAIGQHDRRYGFNVFGATEGECARQLAEYGRCPYGLPGDRLWVRESTEADYDTSDAVVLSRYCADKAPVMYWNDDDGDPIHAVEHWSYPRDVRPSIHMLRTHSRILLEITNVRVERLQEGEGETPFESRYIAEGIHKIHHGDGEFYYHPLRSEPGPGNWADPFDAWRELWCAVNGSESWNANPWVWVVEFNRVAPGEAAL
ncbi:hypothetical protein [Stutzerimonas stutzeri]|uniref:hypothetical protein n=1 Tax=Stutzerimonas stutzeri TaxID=316 RepID=UPI0005EAD3EF|nr:hypothetical protein [Stutzerimonas stutzeri]